MPSGDYSAEFKQRFADGYADGATIAMLQHEFGLAKSPRREYPLSALLEPIGMPRSESESTPIPLTPFTPPSGGLRLWASWPLRTRRG